MSNSNSMKPFGMETKSKTMRACIRPKVDNIVLIGQYRVGHEISQSQQLVSERFDEDLQEDQNTFQVGMRPFKVEREVRQRLVRRSWNCGKNILKATQSNPATKGVECRRCGKTPR